MDTPFSAYRGEDPYVFICYSHADSGVVFPELLWLHEQGVKVWYDEGISGGQVWREEIGNAILSAEKVLYYVSRNSLDSSHCSREINFALDENIEIVPIYLENVPLTTDLRLGLGWVQALFRFDDSRYKEHLLRVANKPAGERVADKPDSRMRGIFKYFRGSLFIAALLAAAAGWILYTQLTDVQHADGRPVTLGITPFAGGSGKIAGLDYEIERRLSASQGLLARVSESAGKSEDYRIDGTLLGSALRLELRDRNGVEVLAWATDIKGDLDAAADAISRAVLARLGRAETVVSRFRETIDPEAFRTFLAATASVRSSHSLDTLRQAEMAFRDVLNSYPQYAPAHAGLCMTVLYIYEERQEQEDFAQAEQHCHRALTLDDQNSEVHRALGMLYRATGQMAKAIDSFHRALALAPYSSDAMRGLADTLFASGSVAEADRWFREAIRVEPSHWENYQALAIYQFQRGDFARAIDSFETALRLAPDEIAITNNLGAAHFMAGNFDQAVNYWKRVVAIQPSPQIYANLGASHFYQRQFAQARGMYEQANRLAPQNYRYMAHIGEALYVSDPAKARPYFVKALDMAGAQLRIDPGDSVTLSDMASYRAALGDAENARKLIEEADAAASEDISVVYNLAVTHARLRDGEAASAALDRLMALGYTRALLDLDANFDGLYSR